VVKLLTNVQGEYGKGPAAKTRALLSAMYEYAIGFGWVTDNPVRKTDRPKFDARQRYLKADEVSRLVEAVNSLRSETARDFFLMCLWTGGRRDNVASMEREELDLTVGVWLIPGAKYKSKKLHTVPLSGPAMEILKRRLKDRKDGARYVFPGRGKRGYYSDPKDAWHRVKELSGISDLRIHDLRRSLEAWQNSGGDSIQLIQQTLGHSNVAITASSGGGASIRDEAAALHVSRFFRGGGAPADAGHHRDAQPVGTGG
jgi:integrase